MISKISVEQTEKNIRYTPHSHRDSKNQQPAFTGIGSAIANAAIRGMQYCEAEPMLNVTVLDLLTAIGPRTVVETVAASKVTDDNGKPVLDENGKQVRKPNFLAGFEAFRRESSGLIINCLIPGVFVMGTAALFNKSIMGSSSNLIKNWADKDTLKVIQEYYEGSGVDNYTKTLKRMFLDLKGADGKAIDKSFAKIYESSPEEFDKIFKNLAELANSESYDKRALKKAVKNIIDKTHITENIKFTTNNPQGKYFGNTLDSLLKNTVEVLHDAKKAGIESTSEFAKYIEKAAKLVKVKSIGGMACILPLAIAAQPINRWITHRKSGKKGAPIYNDDKDHVILPEEKRKLLGQKFLSIGSMLALSWSSMMFKMPSFGMIEFKKFFPTMDQARIVSTATFASRMGASEDFNDLRESTVRDLATFASFYFLGDHVAKAIATIIEKRNPDIKLINELKPLQEGANPMQKFWHWAKHSALKSTDELTSKKAANLRSVCQMGNMAFSLLALGAFIPLINRIQTKKKEEARKAQLAQASAIAAGTATGGTGATKMGAASGTSSTSEATTASDNSFGMNFVDKTKTAFGAFFNS